MRSLLLIGTALLVTAAFAAEQSTRPASIPATLPATRPAELEGDWAKMKAITPRGYVVGRTSSKMTIDGKPDEAEWNAAPWTADFVDIEGDRRPAPRFRTRAKMLWDDECLYIYAELQEPHVWGTITKKNSVIFHDNDFEVFIDPDADNHNYYEFEMNALNTIWELTLEKPYRDGGPVHDPTNIEGLRTAVHVNGTLNDPSDTDRGWSVEIAIPWKGLARYAGSRPCPPKDGQQIRMGFSRVEWLIDIIDGKYHPITESRPEDNWIWSPQGVIDMHRPERWGFVQFSDEAPGKGVFHPDPSLPARDALMEVYYRQGQYKKQMGRYATSPEELGIAQTRRAEDAIAIQPSAAGYSATMKYHLQDGASRTLHLSNDSKLWEE